MTGFGRGEATGETWSLSVELSGVNRKQIDISINLPRHLNELESEVRQAVSNAVSRGRINVAINIEYGAGGSAGDGNGVLVVDESLARQYIAGAKSILGESCSVQPGDLFRAPGIFRVEDAQVDPDAIREPLLEVLHAALSEMAAMQEKEGAHLREDLEERISSIESEIAAVADHGPQVVERYRVSLFKRLRESGLENLDLDDDRVLREIGLFAEKCDISEEITRIASHVAQFREYFSSNDPVGRPLDFLCQELNREFNTIGSKANDAAIAQRIVNAKTELEKIREQVQNVQ